MDCETITGDLTAYIDGELSDARKSHVETHLEHCPQCREEYHSLELSARFIETHARELQPAAEIWSQVRTRISGMEAPAPAAGLLQFLTERPWWSATATVVAVLVLAIGLRTFNQYQTAKRDLNEYMNHYVQMRDAEEQTHQRALHETQSDATDVDFVHAKYSDNPFATVEPTPDKNPFRSEDQ